jgi:uncharacterized protein (DUF302 family)
MLADMQTTMNTDGLITRGSAHGPAETADRLVAAVEKHGLPLAARIDHAAAADHAALSLRPTEVFIFGNARGGTPLMQVAQTAGIDLPLKALVWQDAQGDTWLSWNDPRWIAQRHGLDESTDKPVEAMASLLLAIATEATSR